MNKPFFYTFAAIILLTAASRNAFCQAVMTMTTSEKYAEIGLKGSGKITIDWGDRKKETHILSNTPTGMYTHIYPDTLEHTITIIGEDIRFLNCNDKRLRSLDVSKNIALESLSCSNNQLKSLDVSKNIALEDLNCSNNQLSSLDLSNNTALTFLGCTHNQLSRLDLSKNIALTNLYCYNNQLISLDLSKNTLLTTLHCYNNQLADLNITKNTVLMELNCTNNKLISLDVSQNTKLRILQCSQNLLTSLDVSRNTNLFLLVCSDNNFSDAAVNELFETLHNKNTSRKKEIYISTFFNCDLSIPAKKGWVVIDESFEPFYKKKY